MGCVGLSVEATVNQVALRNQGVKALPAQILNNDGVPAKLERHVRI